MSGASLTLRGCQADPLATGSTASSWLGLDALPDAGRYGVIAVDPPYRFKVRNRSTGLGRSADRHYATLNLDDIKAMPVAQLAGPNCWLMLWTPWPHLHQALEIMAAWGFAYTSNSFVWVKLRRGYRPDLLGIRPSDLAMGLGYTTRKASEPCLLGRSGNPRRVRNDVRDVILAPVREHSRKPNEFYERVEQFAPGPRLDLFARERRPGWDAWGNELDKFESHRLKQKECQNDLLDAKDG